MFGTRLCLLLFLSSIARNGATSQTDRIVGGWVVHRREDFPFQVSLRFDNSPHCGASIIDHRNVLTAAHCVSDELGRIFPARRLSAVVGDLHTDRISPTTVTRQARRVFVHERYNPINLRNDIAVVRIDMLTFDAYINSVPISRAIPPAGTNCTVSGWGVTSFGGPPSNVLRYVIIPTVSFTICRELLGSSILTGMMCAGTDGRDSCTGDSGGPLVCNGIQVGVVSWGFKCGEPDFPGVYTNVEHYFTWIQIQQERSSSSSNLICNACMVFLSVILYIFVCNNYKLI